MFVYSLTLLLINQIDWLFIERKIVSVDLTFRESASFYKQFFIPGMICYVFILHLVGPYDKCIWTLCWCEMDIILVSGCFFVLFVNEWPRNGDLEDISRFLGPSHVFGDKENLFFQCSYLLHLLDIINRSEGPSDKAVKSTKANWSTIQHKTKRKILRTKSSSAAPVIANLNQ